MAARPCLPAAALLLAFAGPAAAGPVYKLPLYRDTVPVYRHGVIKSYKTAYFGEVTVGDPPQKFTTIFDTGSAQVILPVADCETDACKVHKRFNHVESRTAQHVNEEGDLARDVRMSAESDRDRTKVRFGTGEIQGGFIKDTVCLNVDSGSADESRLDCARMHVVGAFHMSDEPFKFFRFDGIVGLGLSSLALTPEFSFFHMLSAKLPPTADPYFGVYIARAEGENSEISFGGYNADRMASPIFWSKVQADHGHWQIQIKRVLVAGVPLPNCEAGDCLAIVDTGCTALGVPREARPWLFERLAQKIEGAHPDAACRDVPAPEIVFELGGFPIALDNQDYYKKMPLVVDGHMRPEIHGVVQATNQVAGDSPTADEAPTPAPLRAGGSQAEADAEFEARAAERYTVCQPSLLPVPTVPPLSSKVFIFGEPVLRKYYTTFDWGGVRVGFAVAKVPPSAPAEQATVQV